MPVPIYHDDIPTIMGTWAHRITTPFRIIVWQKSGRDRITYSAFMKDDDGNIIRTPLIQGVTVTEREFTAVFEALEI